MTENNKIKYIILSFVSIILIMISWMIYSIIQRDNEELQRHLEQREKMKIVNEILSDLTTDVGSEKEFVESKLDSLDKSDKMKYLIQLKNKEIITDISDYRKLIQKHKLDSPDKYNLSLLHYSCLNPKLETIKMLDTLGYNNYYEKNNWKASPEMLLEMYFSSSTIDSVEIMEIKNYIKRTN